MQKDTTVGNRKFDPNFPSGDACKHLTRLLDVALSHLLNQPRPLIDRAMVDFAEGRSTLPPHGHNHRWKRVFGLGYHLGTCYQGGTPLSSIEAAVVDAHNRGLEGGEDYDAVPFAKGFKCGQTAVWLYEHPGRVPAPADIIAPWDNTPTGLTVQ